MKPLLLALLCLVTVAAHSTNYYFSSSTGDDSRTSAQAQNSSTPWRTIAKLNSSTFSPGDSIFFKRGDTWTEALTIPSSGTSGNPIVISAYGSGAKPTFSGFTTLTGWTSVGGNLYEKVVPGGQSTLNVVNIDNSFVPKGRYPKLSATNEGWLKYQSHSGNSSITSNGIASIPNFVGGEVVIRKVAWILDKNTVTSQNSTTIGYTQLGENNNPTNNFGFFFQNHVNACTSFGEWAYNSGAAKLTMNFGGNNPTNYSIKVSTVQNLVSVRNKNYITFDNINLEGANQNAFFCDGSSNITIQNCDIKDIGQSGLYNPNYQSLSRVTIQNCSFSNMLQCGIDYRQGSFLTFNNNTVDKVGYYRGAGELTAADRTGMVTSYAGPDFTARYNSITNCGKNAIEFSGNNSKIEYNYINGFSLNVSDGGGIYGWGGNGTVNLGGNVFNNNIILNGWGEAYGTPNINEHISFGIYIDDNCQGFTVNNNTLAQCGETGLYVHNSHTVTALNNTTYDNGSYELQLTNDGYWGPNTIYNLNIQNNIFFHKNIPTWMISISNVAGNMPAWGTINNNKYLNVDPNDGNYIIHNSFNTFDYPQYRAYSGQDANSTIIPPAPITNINQVRFEYNATNSNKTVNLGSNYMNANGTVHAGSITLAPFTSAILIPTGPVNQPPVANAGANQNITLPVSTVTVNGSGTDPDGTIASYLWTKIAGPAATIASANQASTVINSLVQGVYQFELRVTDNQGAFGRDTVVITVNAAPNQAPTANAGANQNITLPVSTVTVSGNGTDPDGTIASYLWTKITGPAATIVSATQASTVINNLVQGVYQFELRVTDNQGGIGRDTVTVTVNAAPNQAPTANAGINQNITLPVSTVTVNGSGTDPDGTIASYLWTKIAGPAATIVSATQASTVINNLVQGVYQFELRVTDNQGAFGRDTVTVTVNAALPNQAPTANAGINQNITLPVSTVTVSGSGTDPDGTIASYLWTKITGPAATIVSATQASTVINGLSQGVYQFELRVTDNQGAFGRDTVTVTVNAALPNQAPTANAGINQNITLPVSTVTVSGSGTDPDGTIASYLWTKITGPAATIVSATQASTVINGLSQGVYQFELRVTDNQGAFGRDTVTITVNAALPNQAPTANAGINQNITLPVNTVTVNGSGTDPDGTIVSYQWTKIGGSAATIVSATQASTVINNLVQGVYQFELRVTDNQGAFGRDTVTVTVNAAIPNQAPTANAGINQNITLPVNTVTVNGSGSDPDGTIASYQWTKIAGPAATIVSATQASTVINGLSQGVYQFELRVTDNQGAFGRDTVTVTVNAAIPNQAPTANAGINQNITLPVNTVTVNGSGTDPDGTIASYQWTKIAGPAATIVSATQASTVINNLVQGVYQFELRVTDNQGAFGRDTVTVTVNAAIPNQAPTANAGINQNITLPVNTVTVNGSGTDPDGTIASYQWTKIAGPAATIVTATQASTVINGLSQGVYQFELRVTDNQGAFGRDTVVITVNAAPNQAPTANAGINQNITLPVSTVTVNGSGTDPDGTIASYLWTKIAGPAATIVSATQASTVINNLVQGVYQFELRVTDNQGAFGRDTVMVTVNAAIQNQAPTVNAGVNQTITLPANSVTVTGNATDPDGTISSYTWTKISGPDLYDILSATSSSTIIKNLVEGTYQFQIRVTDNSGASATDIIVITVRKAYANKKPTSRAGNNKTIVLPTNNVTLEGSGTDPDGVITSYSWRVINSTNAISSIRIVNSAAATTEVTDLTEGHHEFELQVTDDAGDIATDTVKVEVKRLDGPVVTIFPNPVSTILNLKVEAPWGSGRSFVEIYNMAGKVVYKESFARNHGVTVKQIFVSRLSSGTYLVKVTCDKNTATTKMVKQ